MSKRGIYKVKKILDGIKEGFLDTNKSLNNNIHEAYEIPNFYREVLSPAVVHLENARNIEKNLWCRPCSQNGKRPCYRKNQVCMDSISVTDVIQSVPSR